MVAATVSTSMPTTPITGQRVLAACFMASVAYISSSVSRLVSLEVVEALRPTLRQRSNVTVMGIKAVVDMPVKAAMTVKPRTRTKEEPTDKPIRPVVAVGSTIIGSIVEIPVGTDGSWSDVYANFNLGLRHR